MSSTAMNQPARKKVEEVSSRAPRGRVPLWKRVLDCALILLAAPVWLPLGVIIAAWVKLVSTGPALFRQERIGLLGSRFVCLKFRTMKPNADPAVHRDHLLQLMTSNRPMNKLDATGDSRLIPGGRWLRALGLDELPQLINVLRGEMSLVGPRPSTSYEHEAFQPRHRRRCETLPGLTGLWQVNGKNQTTFERMMELDLAYVENKSPVLDIRIIAATLPAIVRQMRGTIQPGATGAKAGPPERVAWVLPRAGIRETVSGLQLTGRARGLALAKARHPALPAASDPMRR